MSCRIVTTFGDVCSSIANEERLYYGTERTTPLVSVIESQVSAITEDAGE